MRSLITLLLSVCLLIGRHGSAVGQDTRSTTAPPKCGDRLLQAGETCTQCAADCTAQACKPGKERAAFSVEFTPPPAPDVSTAVFRIGYRTDLLSLPGSGTDTSVQTRLTTPEHAVMAFNDLDYALRIVAARTPSLPEGLLVTIDFDRCDGARAPTAADVSCAVEACAASTGPIDGCRCQVTAVAH